MPRRFGHGANLADSANPTRPVVVPQDSSKRDIHQPWELNPTASVVQMPTPVIGVQRAQYNIHAIVYRFAHTDWLAQGNMLDPIASDGFLPDPTF